MKEAWGTAHHEPPQAAGVEKALNMIGMSSNPFLRPLITTFNLCPPFNADSSRQAGVRGTLEQLPGQQLGINTLAKPMNAFLDTPQIAEEIQKGVSTFMEAVPPLMEALDGVAKIHPFIAGANLFFQGHAALMAIYRI